MADRSGVYIDSTAEVHPDAEIGTGTKVWNWTKIREKTRIGANCSIGQGVYIDFDVIIGDGCKIQNGVSLYHGMTIGDRVFIGPNATFTNDRFPRAESAEWEVVTTVIEDGASIGANATVRCGVKLGTYCMVAAGAVVTRDVPPFGLVAGTPARLVDYVDMGGHPLNHPLDGPPPARERLLGPDRAGE
jgi:UDP-2-acetamido-3-amino-2,3-dideoxy-glucuronate N-acetyltransferase